jgi:hypothetical protein
MVNWQVWVCLGEGGMDVKWEPGWTTAVKIESGGRYPLGLNRFHNGLEEILAWFKNPES